MATRKASVGFLLALLASAFALQAAAQGLPGQAALPERKDVVSWKLLGQVELVREKNRYSPKFASSVVALNGKEVRLQGFMIPLSVGERQAHFILSATPPTCAFCLPGGPEQMAEVKAREPVPYGFDPVVVSGRLQVLRDDASGVYYRLTDAVQVK